ncbi:hypothetical protein T11_6003 [Trichinella zimbabwensis]|uniref:Uncharacterized protein n=1 Tax=Trichinella zimbabwensis TaxID=268475 RepID=A0A0V1GLR3_9BILA|nr:hypothetical protein T11_6003 [Trichinella zimbabwensis]
MGRHNARSAKSGLSKIKIHRTFRNAATCHVSQTNECALTDDKAPLW